MTRPPLGYLDPAFLAELREESDGLRAAFGTASPCTFALSGTGMSGMECALANLLEPGERLLVCVNGFFGERMAEVASRHAIEVHRVEADWGRAIDVAQLATRAREVRPQVVAFVHAETSTGCLQPLEPLAREARAAGALVVADCVTSIGGVVLDVDRAGIDVAYAGSQKCLGAPSGLAPVAASPRALDRIRRRATPPSTWYHDLVLLERYFGASPPSYHHTPSYALHSALREALRALREEGIEESARRHRRNHLALVAGVEALGLQMLVAPELRAPMLNAVVVPDGIDEAKLRSRLREKDRIEIGAGLGKLRGRIIRIGLMGHSSRAESVTCVLAAIAAALTDQGRAASADRAVEAAREALRAAA